MTIPDNVIKLFASKDKAITPELQALYASAYAEAVIDLTTGLNGTTLSETLRVRAAKLTDTAALVERIEAEMSDAMKKNMDKMKEKKDMADDEEKEKKEGKDSKEEEDAEDEE